MVNIQNGIITMPVNYGGIAQLARAPALQAGGHRFESDYLHHYFRNIARGKLGQRPACRAKSCFATTYRNIAQLVRAPP